MSTPDDGRYRPTRARLTVWIILIVAGVGLIVAGIVTLAFGG